MIRYHEATPMLLMLVAQNLRDADRLEVERATGVDYLVSILLLPSSADLTIGEWNDKPLGVFGLQRHEDGSASPFMLGCTFINECKLEFQKEAKKQVALWRGVSDHLWNFVDSEHRDAIDWLETMGFIVSPGLTIKGPAGHPFRYFEWRAD